jgi:HD-GYP domain-containing protein (c-di-GMP phosphodiesterase class II)
MENRSKGIAGGLNGFGSFAGEFGGCRLQFIVSALREYDSDTYYHSLRTLRLCALIGPACGLGRAQLRVLKLGALLHDVGKLYVPREVLRTPAPLTDEEWAVMRRHPQDGRRLLLGVPGLTDVARVVFQHHESWDGSGYPHGLSGEEIDFNARIVAAADAFDSMVSDRPYRPALSYEVASAELNRCAGTQFDPQVVETLHRVTNCQTATDIRLSQSRPEAPLRSTSARSSHSGRPSAR